MSVCWGGRAGGRDRGAGQELTYLLCHPSLGSTSEREGREKSREEKKKERKKKRRRRKSRERSARTAGSPASSGTAAPSHSQHVPVVSDLRGARSPSPAPVPLPHRVPVSLSSPSRVLCSRCPAPLGPARSRGTARCPPHRVPLESRLGGGWPG